MSLEEINKLRQELEEKMLKCSVNMRNDIRDALVEVNRLAEHLDAFKQEANDTFSKHELQRVSFNKSIEAKLDNLEHWFINHNENEMAKYDEIIALLTATAKETDTNAEFISKLELEEAKKQAVIDANAPREAVWNKVKMTAIGVTVTVLTGGVLSAVWFGLKMYIALNLGSVE